MDPFPPLPAMRAVGTRLHVDGLSGHHGVAAVGLHGFWGELGWSHLQLRLAASGAY